MPREITKEFRSTLSLWFEERLEKKTKKIFSLVDEDMFVLDIIWTGRVLAHRLMVSGYLRFEWIYIEYIEVK